MSDNFTFLMLKDEFYEEFKIPKLPLPMTVEDLKNGNGSGGMSFPQMVDNLLVFLDEEPGEMEKYRHTLTTLSYYAGTWESDKGNFETAYKYLRIAQKHGDIKNVSIIYNLGLTCMQLKKMEEAHEVFFLGYAFTRNQQFIPEIWMMLIVCDYMVGKVDEGKEVIRDFFEAGKKRYPTSHAALYQDLYNLAMVSCEDPGILREIEKYEFLS